MHGSIFHTVRALILIAFPGFSNSRRTMQPGEIKKEVGNHEAKGGKKEKEEGD